MTDTSLIRNEKRELRARMKARRTTLDSGQAARAGEALADHSLSFLPPPPPGSVVSGFAPLPGELRIWPLLRRLAGSGVALALPVVHGKGLPLLFRAWKPGDSTERGVWNIPQPKADKPVVEPDILLVPLLAFDRQGWRLGYGGGFYDRTLALLRARKTVTAIGLGYDQQQVDSVPHLPYDQRLDWVLTPSGPIKCAD